MTKILLAIDSLRGGGKERQFVELTKGIKLSTSHQIEVLSFSEDVHYNEIFNLGVGFYTIPRKKIGESAVLFQFNRVLRKTRPEIIHSWNPLVSMFLVFFKPFYGFKLIEGSIRSAPPRRMIASKDYNRIAFSSRFADSIVANSQAGLKSYNIRKKGLAIYNGFDLGRIINLPSEGVVPGYRETIRIGMVGNFTDVKDYESFFAAAREITKKYPETEFIAIGGGPNLKSFRDRFREQKNFVFSGPVKDVEHQISRLDICVLCSTEYGEGISNSLLEYMSLKKPIVALDCPGNREVIEDEKTGLLYRLRDIQSLADRIGRLIEDDELRKNIGLAGFEVLRTKFSYEKMISSYSDLYQNIMTKSNI